ncbi:MAG: MFS transporter [Anaerolineales bacterium]|nr:MFS transporter [Anaerolineales bacterium]
MIRFWFKLFYTVEFVGVGVFMPYVAVYFIRKGLTNAEIGYLLALTPFAGFIAQPVWGAISDKLNMTRILVTIGCLSTSILALAFTVTDRFEYLIVIVVTMSILRAPIHPNIAALALNHLEIQGKQEEFGRFRLWGSIGFVVATLFTGGLLFEHKLTIAIYLYSGCMLLLGFISLMLPDRHIATNLQWREGLRLIADNRALRLFLLGILCVGITLGISNQFLVVYMNELNASAWIIGATVAVSALPEIPIMSFAETFIRKWGLRITYVVGISVLPVRWLFNMLVTDPNIALPVQVLHGVAMSSLLCVGVIYIDNILPDTWRASGQALYVSSLYGLGPSIGLFFAGLVMSYGSTKPLWALCLGAGVIGCYIVNSAMRIRSTPILEVS